MGFRPMKEEMMCPDIGMGPGHQTQKTESKKHPSLPKEVSFFSPNICRILFALSYQGASCFFFTVIGLSSTFLCYSYFQSFRLEIQNQQIKHEHQGIRNVTFELSDFEDFDAKKVQFKNDS